MRLLAPAKINLHLRVGPPRADGFHPLLSWFVTAGLFDTLILEPDGPGGAACAPAVGGDGKILLTCDPADLPCDQRNLVVRVAEAWGREAAQMKGSCIGPVRATLHKQIPAGAGLGGGSSDGARALIGVDRLWHTNADTQRLAEFSARFGSDLPFFFHGPSSVCTGRGEIVRPIAPPAAKWAVLFLPDIQMPTPAVYKKFDEMKLGRQRDVEQEPDWILWTKMDVTEVLSRVVNDLEPAAFAIEPKLGALRLEIEQALHRPVRMSGSGSSLFTLYENATDAQDAAVRMVTQYGLRAVEVEIAPRIMDDLV